MTGARRDRTVLTRTPIQLTVKAPARALQSLYQGKWASLTHVSFSYLYILMIKRRYRIIKKQNDANWSASPTKKTCDMTNGDTSQPRKDIADAR